MMESPQPPRPKILLGSTNRKKVEELRRKLTPLGIELVSLNDLAKSIEIEENGSTFMENAELKGIGQATFHQIWAIGEDSGLCVPALNGAPGIYSARYSGDNATDASNNALLLENMKSLPLEKRSAYYVSTIVLSDPSGNIVARAQGECHGRILNEPRGAGGFGYDPLFEVIEYHQTFAELGLGVKSSLSHRGRALERFIPQLKKIFPHPPQTTAF